MTDKILSISRKSFPDIVNLRRELHQIPELAFQETNTALIVTRELNKLNIGVRKKVGKTGVVGVLKGTGRGKVVALRADMDALPITEESGVPFKSRNSGKMHACGHDAHMAMLLGAARILNEIRNDLNGTVKFLFQPSEEKNPGGAPSMIKDGALSDPAVDAIFGQHITAEIPTGKFGFRAGPLMASADEVYLTVIGKGGHGASPHKAVDPIPVAAQIVTSLQNVISRMKDPLQPSVLTIGSIHGGSATNVISDEVKMSGTFRAMDEGWRETALGLIKRTAVGTAKSLGASCEVEISRGYPVLMNWERETEIARKSAENLFGKRSAFKTEPVMSAEDFAFFLKEVPGSFWWIGAGNKNKGATASIHSARFKIDEDVLMYGAAMLAGVAMEYLNDGGEKD